MRLIKILSALLVACTSLLAAYAQFYPIEIFINPIGYQNQIPGAPIEDYTTFSALRVSLNKDLPSNKKVSNKIIFNGSGEWYHQAGKERDYFPFYLNTSIRSHLFLSDIITAGVDLNGNLESVFGIDKPLIGKYDDPLDSLLTLFQSDSTTILPIKMIYNRRGRLIPFFYIALTPDLLMYNGFTFGRSVYSEKYYRTIGMTKNDYDILKAETKLIYFSPIHIRFFIAPYVYKNRYHYTTARDASGYENPNNPLLREEGYGSSFGARYSTFRWGYIEFQVELEKNIDKIFGSNDYKKILLNLKLENQYFTDRFGYIISTDFTRHYFSNFVTSTDVNDEDGKLSDKVYRLDIMPIFNLSKNVSIRPQYDLTFKDNDGTTRTKNRFWLHLHLLW